MQLNLYQYHLSRQNNKNCNSCSSNRNTNTYKLEMNRIATNIGIPKANCYSSCVFRGMFFEHTHRQREKERERISE